MFAASAYQQRAIAIGSPVFIVVEGIVLVCGLVMTYKAYVRRDGIGAVKPPVPTKTGNHTDK
jgi:hypothetical protein